MSNSWLRLWHDMPNDPKWRTIARVSGQPVALVQAVYLHLLVDASRNVTRGHVTVTTEDLASALDVTDEQIVNVIDAMQGRVLDGDALTGWDNRQPKREDAGNPERGAKSAAQRKREQREREREASKVDDVTQCHAESRNVTLDKDTEEEKEHNPPYPPEGVEPAVPSPKLNPLDACPENVTPSVWAEWVKCRSELRKPLKETTCKAQAKQLAGHPNPDAVIQASISAGWMGLFPDRVKSNVHPIRKGAVVNGKTYPFEAPRGYVTESHEFWHDHLPNTVLSIYTHDYTCKRLPAAGEAQ
ncbi:hypothetical protein [Pseudomonas aeruginosa]|uniref:hypothetical protein n=1 Tax=Pseudomonas aeruginosa TaxID=287 RepID=UPI000AE3AD66|nr:hypothetical protein [Pseudomonas aeruginosa]